MDVDKKNMKKRGRNAVSFEKNGWQYISVSGTPEERGFNYGFFCASAFKDVQSMLKYMTMEDVGLTWESFIEAGITVLRPTIQEKFPEIWEEMSAIAKGCTAGGTPTTADEILAWNNYFTLIDSWYPNQSKGSGEKHSSREGGAKDHCSAFIAVGDYTHDRKIVMAHNSFTNFIDGQYFNVILDIQPQHGHRILMQTFPCGIWSGTDFFVTSAGIMGTETTIGGFLPYENNYTIACRIRQAMQYGNTLDEYVEILKDGNSGDYANSWMFGDTRTQEIMVLELGLKYTNVKRTKNGCFIGCNVAFDPKIRNLECADTGYCDVRRHQGARQVRLPDLMEEYKGKINVEIAEKIIGDHYDVYLERINPCSRTVCSHYELDGREYMSDPSRPKPFQPRGAVDGSVCDSASASKMGFYMKYGSSCDIGFDAKSFCDKHRQWGHLLPYLKDRPSQPWTYFSSLDNSSKHKTPLFRKLKRKTRKRGVKT